MSARTGNDPSLSDLWREFRETEAAINAAADEIELDDPLQVKNLAAAHAIVAARPTELAELSIQMQYFQHVLDGGSAPNYDESLMLAHVLSRLAVMAGLMSGTQPSEHPPAAAGPLSSTF
jgi:hypothetical protein